MFGENGSVISFFNVLIYLARAKPWPGVGDLRCVLQALSCGALALVAAGRLSCSAACDILVP